MAISDKQKKQHYKYEKAHIKRIPLDVQSNDYPAIMEQANLKKMSVNAFIKHEINKGEHINMDDKLYLQREVLLENIREVIADISRYSIALSSGKQEISPKHKGYLTEAYALKLDILFCEKYTKLISLSFKLDEYKKIATKMEMLVNGF